MVLTEFFPFFSLLKNIYILLANINWIKGGVYEINTFFLFVKERILLNYIKCLKE